MRHTTLLLWCAILVAAVSAYTIYTMTRNIQQSQQPYYVPIDYKKLARDNHLGPKDFVLTNQDGNLFYSNKELKGKVWILNFFFSTCTQNCHRTNQALAEIQRKFPNDDLMILSVSCNPELDNTEVLKSYAEQFNANLNQWQFLTGNFDEIKKRIAKRFLLAYERGSHQDKIVVVGRDGVWRDTVELLKSEEKEKLMHNLRTWLDEPAPKEENSKESSAKESAPKSTADERQEPATKETPSDANKNPPVENESEKKGI